MKKVQIIAVIAAAMVAMSGVAFAKCGGDKKAETNVTKDGNASKCGSDKKKGKCGTGKCG